MSGAEKGSLELRDLLERRSTLEPGTTIDRDRLIRGSSCLLVSSGGGDRVAFVPPGEGQKNYEWIFKEGEYGIAS